MSRQNSVEQGQSQSDQSLCCLPFISQVATGAQLFKTNDVVS